MRWLLLLGTMLLTLPTFAQRSGQVPEMFKDVGVDEKLGEYIPQDLIFFNEEGESVTLASYFDGERPVVLNFVYHTCPAMCSLMLSAMTQTFKDMAWTAGGEFDVLTVSFSSIDTPDVAAQKKAQYVEMLGRPEAASGWHFLTGSDASIQALAEATGFKFVWVEEQQEYAHAATLLFISGDGQITRYLHGMNMPARFVRNALVEASDGTVGNPLDQLILYCYQYDPTANSYVLQASNAMRIGGGLFVVLLGALLFIFWRRERTKLEATLKSV